MTQLPDHRLIVRDVNFFVKYFHYFDLWVYFRYISLIIIIIIMMHKIINKFGFWFLKTNKNINMTKEPMK